MGFEPGLQDFQDLLDGMGFEPGSQDFQDCFDV
jgi:hypothetical protein